jgi:alpha-mannosidase
LASDIPSLGYKVYEVKNGKAKAMPDAALFTGHVFENDFYKLTLTNQGVITSLNDKRNGSRECVKAVNGRFMNDLGSGASNTGTIKVTNAGPVSVTVVCSGKEPLSHSSSITLFRDIPRIDIQNMITQNFADVQHWAFSYNVQDAEVWHEEIGAVLKAKPVTEGGHYATRNARFDWLTLNHFADITNGKYGITLSNADCAFMKPGNSALTNLDTQTSQLSVLAGGQVDGENLGILKQGGDSLFIQRFAIGTHKEFDAASSMRFSLEHQNSLVGGLITGMQKVYPEKEYSFLTISDPNVLLWSLKPADDGVEKGLIARVWNFSNKDTEVKISFETDITSAHQATHVETDIREARVVSGDLHESIGHHQLKTFRILLK